MPISDWLPKVLWVTKVEGIFKVWVRRVIKSSLVDDHFASPALLICVVVGNRLTEMAAATFSYCVDL
jgi:nitrate reductase gamma subunit